ncbi:MAG: class I tRNA ligase family protein [bacterium]|nr:class I tRNA ligase family protein [bacterium]
MAKGYDPKEIEGKWQKEWEKSGIYKAEDKSHKTKYYSLMEFPYPSGDGLHTGHVRGYTAMDIVSRKRRMEGFNVMFPIGWDAFGLPTENYALKTGRPPAEITKKNTDNYRFQFKRLGMSFDWFREINTTDPKYYKWTQWIFLKFLEKGLAYKAKIPINWCPSCKIGLANEEVVDDNCERCGTPVEQKEKEQWMLAITKYADRLHDDLDTVDYPERVKTQQRNWIGKSEGAEINFSLKFKKHIESKPNFLILHGYTGRADKNFIPWLKTELKSQGFKVQTPQMPNTDSPRESEQVNYVIENCHIDEKTIIVGHNLGGVVAMKVLQKINRSIAGLVLVAPAVEPSFRTGSPRPFWETFNFDYDYGLLKKLTNFRVVISDLLEKGKRGPYLDYLQFKLQAQFIEGTAQEEHLTGVQEPIILNALLPQIKVFTTRPDTLLGATYLVLAPEHSFVTNNLKLTTNKDELVRYIVQTKNKTDIDRSADGKEKTGVELKGIKAINPGTKEEIPVWIADYVLSHYGTGAIMGVPADDERDMEFARKYKLPIVENYQKAGFEDFGKKVTKYKLRDWVFSRQRYWGEPIPVIHCEKCGMVPVPEKDLPVELPVVEKYEPGPDGESPLANITEWVDTKCPKCGGKAKRETDVMPNWAGSSWYFLRYCDPHNDKEFVSRVALDTWMPVDWYNGGMEHTVLHLLYSRFWNKFLYDLKLVPTSEPYKKRTSHGLILAEGGEKMSKSKGNVINPDSIVNQFGADTLRLYEMFMGPFEQAIAWNEESLVGPHRFLEKVWRLQFKVSKGLAGKGQTLSINSQGLTLKSETLMHQTIKKVSEDIESMGFNTAVSTLMIFANALDKQEKVSQKEFETLLLLLAPFAPHITEELWSKLGFSQNSIHLEPWPTYDSKKLLKDEITLAVQINGKVRASLLVSRGQSEEEIRVAALSLPAVKKWLDEKEPKKVIIVPERIISIVT